MSDGLLEIMNQLFFKIWKGMYCVVIELQNTGRAAWHVSANLSYQVFTIISHSKALCLVFMTLLMSKCSVKIGPV